MRISNDRGSTRYYHVSDGTAHEEDYIPKSNLSLAKELAQKDYNRTFLEMAGKELNRIERLIKQLSAESADTAYSNLNEHRRALITPYIYTDDKYAEEWLKMSYRPNPYKQR